MYFCSILIWNKFLITNQWSIKLSEVWHLEKNYEKCFHTWKFGPLQFLKNLKTNSKFLINCRMIYLYLLGSKLGVHFGLPKIHTPVKGLYKIGNLQLLVEKKKKGQSCIYQLKNAISETCKSGLILGSVLTTSLVLLMLKFRWTPVWIWYI